MNKITVVIDPLPLGFGHTLGNSLRRVLLSSLPGAAVTQVKFAGVPHQFTTIPGVKEDVVEICLSLKKLRLKIHGENPVVLKLVKSGPADVKASDFDVPSDAKIINGDLHIATLADKSTKIDMEVVAEVGRGYVPSEERESNKIGVLLLDSVFSPVSVVSYSVEPTRVGRNTNLDKLTVNIQTDGTIAPFEAFQKGCEVLTSFFLRLASGVPDETLASVEVVAVKDLQMSKKEDIYLEELPLPTRTINALKKAGMKTLADLAAKSPDELSEVKNLGDKSVDEIHKLLAKEGF